MPLCETKYFGTLEYSDSAMLEFPRGLPGFDDEQKFIVIDHPATKPLVYLQSLATSELCFVALPVQVVMAKYELELAEEDRELIGVTETARLGTGLLCLTLISIRENITTANLMAPIVASLDTRKAVQSICATRRYSHQHRIGS